MQLSETEAPAIGALAPWFGAKRTLAPAIVEEFGSHSSFWDVFCGSMAVFLAKSPCRQETVNDLHGDLVNLAHVVQCPKLGPAFYRRLRRVWNSQDLFRESLGVVREGAPSFDPDIDRAFHYFVASWQGMNGVSGTATTNTNFARRFSSKGGDASKRFGSAVKSIPQWRRRLSGVNILRSDGIELCERIWDRTGTVIYADPPYLVKGAKYLHDFSETDHDRLALALRRFRETRVVISYYDHPRLKTLYPGWTVRRLDATKSLVNSRKRDQSGATDAPEVLLINGSSFVDVNQDHQMSLFTRGGK